MAFPLHQAAEDGDVPQMRALLRGAPRHPSAVDETNDDGATPLYKAAGKGNAAMVRFLLDEANADMHKGTALGATPLIIAAQGGHMGVGSIGHSTVVRALVAAGADVNQRAHDGRTATYMAATQGHDAVLCFLVSEAKADANQGDDLGTGPLTIAAHNGHAAAVRFLLSRAEIDANQAGHAGWTALHSAAGQGQDHVVQILLAHGVELNRANNQGATPLWVAARNGHVAVAHTLARHNADLNQATDHGLTPLFIAAAWGETAMVQLLAVLSADFAPQVQGQNAEDIARARDRPGIAGFLSTVAGWPAFKIAVACRLDDTARLALRHGWFDSAGCTLAELAVVSRSGADALWPGSRAACPRTTRLVPNAMGGWTPARHALFHLGVRRCIRVVLLLQLRLTWQHATVPAHGTAHGSTRVPELPVMTWRHICSFLRRKDWRPE